MTEDTAVNATAENTGTSYTCTTCGCVYFRLPGVPLPKGRKCIACVCAEAMRDPDEQEMVW